MADALQAKAGEVVLTPAREALRDLPTHDQRLDRQAHEMRTVTGSTCGR
jgi:hypothetical protein